MQLTRIELLQRMPIFGAIREDFLLMLLTNASAVDVRAGDYFFRENDQADSMFVLEAGRVAVIKGWRGHDFVLHGLDVGDRFGEMALMNMFPRSASVRAEKDCSAIEIGADGLLHLFEWDVEQFALIQMNIGREVCRRLRAADEMLFRAKTGDMPAERETMFLAA